MSASPFPHFELKRVDSDGSESALEVVPITRPPWDISADRRGFLGAGVAVASVLGFLGGEAAARSPADTPKGDPGARSSSGTAGTMLAHGGAVKGLAFLPDGETIVSASLDQTVKIWPLRPGSPPTTLPFDEMAILALAVAPSGGAMAIGGDTTEPARFWSWPRGKYRKNIPDPLGPVNAVAFAPDGATLFAGSARGQLKLVAVPEGKLIRVLAPHLKPIRGIAVSPHVTTLATASDDGTVVLSGLPGARYLKTLADHSGPVLAVAFAPDGKSLASASADATVRLRAVPEGTLIWKWNGPKSGFNALVVAPDGDHVAAGAGDGKVYIWSARDGGLVQTLALPGGTPPAVDSLAISPHGKTLAVGYHNGLIVLWDLGDAKPRGFLFDRARGEDKTVAYNVTDPATGRTVTYTLPCGSSVPAGAVCTCNCVSTSEWVTARRGSGAPAAAPPLRPSGEIVARQPISRPKRRRYRPPDEAMGDVGDLPEYDGPAPGMGSGFTPFNGGFPTFPGGMQGGGTICTCNKVCTCIPVCQAHKLLHEDPVVRTLAEQTLLAMGPREFPYMAWAADRADDPALRDRVRQMMAAIAAGAVLDPARWPGPRACASRLDHPDEVVALMAAQALRFLEAGAVARLNAPLGEQVERLLSAAARRPWHARTFG